MGVKAGDRKEKRRGRGGEKEDNPNAIFLCHSNKRYW